MSNMASDAKACFSSKAECRAVIRYLYLKGKTGKEILLGWNVALVTLYQDYSSNHDSSKTMAARGWVLFFPIYLNRKL